MEVVNRFWSGWNDVSWHNQKIHSPSLQQLAEEGILLDQYYVQPTCSPSRAAFMTGQYPYRLGRQHMYIKPLMPTGLPANVKVRSLNMNNMIRFISR